jgi:hypothetical protein
LYRPNAPIENRCAKYRSTSQHRPLIQSIRARQWRHIFITVFADNKKPHIERSLYDARLSSLVKNIARVAQGADAYTRAFFSEENLRHPLRI